MTHSSEADALQLTRKAQVYALTLLHEFGCTAFCRAVHVCVHVHVRVRVRVRVRVCVRVRVHVHVRVRVCVCACERVCVLKSLTQSRRSG